VGDFPDVALPCRRGVIGIPGANGLASDNNGVAVPRLMGTRISVLQCPSDDYTLLTHTGHWQFEQCEVTTTNYKGVLDDTYLQAQISGFGNDLAGPDLRSGRYDKASPTPGSDQRDCHRDARCRGIFFRNSWKAPVTVAKVTDGTSKTLMIGEDLPELNYHSAAYYANGDWCSCNIPLNYGLGLSEGDRESFARDRWHESQGFKSKHPGGVQFCLADGSVRFILENVDNIHFRVSCTRNGDEPTLGDL
jgi:Protein of unknown function (DUF1559)